MAPKPVIAKDLFQTQLREALENRPEISHNMLRPILRLVTAETPIDGSAGSQAVMQRFDCAERIDEMLEDIHRGDEVEYSLREGRVFEVEETCLKPTLTEAILAECQHLATDIGQRYVEAIASRQQCSRSYAGAEIEICLAIGQQGEFQSGNIVLLRYKPA